jgi:hypothetical protein
LKIKHLLKSVDQGNDIVALNADVALRKSNIVSAVLIASSSSSSPPLTPPPPPLLTPPPPHHQCSQHDAEVHLVSQKHTQGNANAGDLELRLGVLSRARDIERGNGPAYGKTRTQCSRE